VRPGNDVRVGRQRQVLHHVEWAVESGGFEASGDMTPNPLPTTTACVRFEQPGTTELDWSDATFSIVPQGRTPVEVVSEALTPRPPRR
jgi:hypothetical protein